MEPTLSVAFDRKDHFLHLIHPLVFLLPQRLYTVCFLYQLHFQCSTFPCWDTLISGPVALLFSMCIQSPGNQVWLYMLIIRTLVDFAQIILQTCGLVDPILDLLYKLSKLNFQCS